MLQIQKDVVDVAMSIVDCEYREQQWGPLNTDVDKKYWYFDCVGGIHWIGNQANVLHLKDGCEEGKRWRGYPPKPDFDEFFAGLKTLLVLLPSKHDAGIADILWFRDGGSLHLGVVTHIQPCYYVVHASLNRGKVRHEAVRNSGAVLRSFRYPGVQEALDANG